MRAIVALPDPVGETIEGTGSTTASTCGACACRSGWSRGLRGAPQRDRRLLGALRQVRQRDRAARVVDGRALERRARAGRRRGGRRRGACPKGRSRSSRAATATSSRELATQDGVVDLIIPRGGEGLKSALKEHATVPVIYAAAGNCHVFVDATADLGRRGRDHGQREGAAARRCATRPRRCSCTPTSPPTSCRACSASCARRGWSCASTAARGRSPGELADSLSDATEEDWDNGVRRAHPRREGGGLRR